MNMTLHASGSVQIGEGQLPMERNFSMDVQILPPADGSHVGFVLLTIGDNLSSSFTLKIMLTAMQASQLGTQLCDLAQDAQHAHTKDVSMLILPGALPTHDAPDGGAAAS